MVVHTSNRARGRNSHRHPDQIRVPVQRQTLEEVRRLAAVPFQHAPERGGDERCVAVHEACGAGEEAKVIDVGDVLHAGKVLGDRRRKEEDQDHGSGDPEGSCRRKTL